MITGFDHVVIAVRDLDGAISAYEKLLGRCVVQRMQRDGAETALIATDNISVELMAAHSESEGAQRLRAALQSGEGLKSIVFATDDLDALHRRADRVGLRPEPIVARDGYRRFRFETASTHGVRLFALQRENPLRPSGAGEAGVRGLDHIVLRSAHLERAAALYGARLGLDLRLDREIAGRRLMFFRCGDAVLEIVHEPQAEADQLWGLCWRVANAQAARERLAGAKVNVSELRAGVKPGTRVFSVRSHTCDVPTLVLEQTGKSQVSA